MKDDEKHEVSSTTCFLKNWDVVINDRIESVVQLVVDFVVG